MQVSKPVRKPKKLSRVKPLNAARTLMKVSPLMKVN